MVFWAPLRATGPSHSGRAARGRGTVGRRTGMSTAPRSLDAAMPPVQTNRRCTSLVEIHGTSGRFYSRISVGGKWKRTALQRHLSSCASPSSSTGYLSTEPEQRTQDWLASTAFGSWTHSGRAAAASSMTNTSNADVNHGTCWFALADGPIVTGLPPSPAGSPRTREGRSS